MDQLLNLVMSQQIRNNFIKITALALQSCTLKTVSEASLPVTRSPKVIEMFLTSGSKALNYA